MRYKISPSPALLPCLRAREIVILSCLVVELEGNVWLLIGLVSKAINTHVDFADIFQDVGFTDIFRDTNVTDIFKDMGTTDILKDKYSWDASFRKVIEEDNVFEGPKNEPAPTH